MAASPGPVVLTKRHIFGSSPHSQILVVDAHHILYQAGHCLVLFNTTKETQKFLNPNKGINNGSIVCATLSKNKRFLAIVEEKEIIIFSMETLRKRKTLPQESHPFEVTRFVSACFNAQGELITLSHYSETNTYHLTQWDWHECRPNVVTPLTNFIENQKIFSGFTSCLCTGEKTHTDVCVISPEGFKVFTLSEKHFIPFNNKFILDKYMEEFDSRPSWTASLWIGEDLILGTHSGDLLLFESHNFHSVIMTPQIKEEGMGNEINCMELITNDCLAVGLNNGCIKILTRASSSNSWELWGETSSYCPHQNPIQSMSISFQKDILYVMSKQKLLCVKLPNFEEPQKENELLEFSEPYSNFHIGDVTGLDTCIRKQLFATCGLDGTIRIWNYQEMLPELTKKYEGVELHSLAFHPSGFHLLVGFPDRLRLLNILLNDLRIQKEFNGIRGCKECQFANGGHLFACVVHNDKIQIVSTWNGQMVHNLRGHTQTVNSLCFTSTDEFLISAGSDGSVYQWNTATGDRIQEFSNRQHPVRAAIATLEDKLYTVGLKGNLREIADNQLERSFELQIGMTALVIGHDIPHRVLIAGGVNGLVRSLKYPITGETGDYIGHEGCITRMCITHDDFYLFTSGVDGCVIMYEIKEKEGRINSNKKSKKDAYFSEEILVTKADLQDMRSRKDDFLEQNEEIQCQHEFHLRLQDVHLQDALKDKNDEFKDQSKVWHEKYAHLEHILEDLELHYEEEIEIEKRTNTEGISDVEAQQQKEFMSKIETYFELEKQQAKDETETEEQTLVVEEEFADKVDLFTNEQENMFTCTMEHAMEKLGKTNNLKSKYEETKTQMFEDQDAEMQEISNEYQGLLTEEKKHALQLKGENAVIKKKFVALQSEIDALKEKAKEIHVHESDRKSAIDSRRIEIQTFEEEMKRLDAIIADKEKKIYELKKKNQNLEKHKFVLDHKIKAAKKQIEPRDNKIMEMTKEVKILDAELEKKHLLQKSLEKQISKCTKAHSEDNLQNKKKQLKLSRANRKMTGFSHDLTELIKYIQNPDTLKKETKKLIRKYRKNEESKLKAFDSFSAEYKFQEQSLKRTIEAKEKMQVIHEHQIFEHELSILSDNQILINQIENLRNHLNQYKLEQYQNQVSPQVQISKDDFEEIYMDDADLSPNFGTRTTN